MNEQTLANFMINVFLPKLKKEGVMIRDSPIQPWQIASIVDMIEEGTISFSTGKQVLDILWDEHEKRIQTSDLR